MAEPMTRVQEWKKSMRARSLLTSLFSAVLLAAGLILAIGVSAGVDADEAQAMDANPTLQDTARLLGYMWGDGEQIGGGVWDVNGPSGTSTLIEELIDRHGGTFVDRGRLQFTLPAPYNWSEWTSSLPNNSATVRAAVQDPNFLAAVLETEASVSGQIYDQSVCCNNGYTIGRLNQLRDLMADQGYSTTSLDRFNNVNSGRILIGASQWDDLRRDLSFVCPAENSVIRIPGGTDLGRYGNIDWIGANSSWGDVVRTDCVNGQAVSDVGAPVGNCSVSASGNTLRIDWSYNLGNVVIRVDGQFVETVSARDGAWTGQVSNGTRSAEVRVFAFGEQANRSCGSVNVGGGGGGGATPPNGQCVVAASGNGVFVDWDNFGASDYNVRRNNVWAATVSGTSATVSGSTNDAWVVRYRVNGNVIDVPCTGGGAAPANGACTITSLNGGVRVDWPGVGGIDEYQVRRNGQWIAESGQSRFDDAAGSTRDDYEIRYFTRGQRNSIFCG